MAPLPLNEKRLDQINNAASTPRELLEKVLSALKTPDYKVTTVSELREYFRKNFSIEHPKDLAGFLIFVQTIRSRNRIDSESLVLAIDEGIEDWEVPQELLDNWNEKKDILAQIASTPVIQYIGKKAELLYRHKTHLHDFRILSEVRPVLDESRKSIAEFLVFHRLHLTFSDPTENETYVEIPIASDDLLRLQNEIEVALSKGNVIQESLSKSTGRSVTIFSRRQST